MLILNKVQKDLTNLADGAEWRGCFEGGRPNQLVGWAFHVADPTQPVTLEMRIKGLLFKTVATSIKRSDIERHINQFCKPGFQIGVDIDYVNHGNAANILKYLEDPSFDFLKELQILISGTELTIPFSDKVKKENIDSAYLDSLRDKLKEVVSANANKYNSVQKIQPPQVHREVFSRTPQELPGKAASPAPGNTNLSGVADSITKDQISGWAVNHRSKDTPVELAVYLGRQIIGRGKTEKYRSDIFENFGGHGFYGFSIRLTSKITREDFSSLRLVALPFDVDLQILPQLAQSLPEEMVRSVGFKGYLDRANRDQISGWAVDESAPEKPTSIDIHVNDVLMRTVFAARARQDLAKFYPASQGNLGFHYQLPFGLSLRGSAAITVKLSVNGQVLSNAPIKGDVGSPGHYLASAEVEAHRHANQSLRLASPQPPAGKDEKVAAIILNRNGAEFLDDLFASIERHNTHRAIEFLVVDHGSIDDTKAICNKWGKKFNIRFINRQHNHSYSNSNNFGVALTDAEFIFLLNNDIRLDSDIIPAALGYLKDDVGVVGLKLATPPEQIRLPHDVDRQALLDLGYTVDQVQHLAVRITTSITDRPFLPYEEPVTRANDSFSSQPIEVPAVTAAALFVRREDFLRVGGLHEEYFYGFEDVDFCLTFTARTGKKILCLNHLKAYHFRSASLERASAAELKAKAQNRDILLRRLGGHIKKRLKDERKDNAPFLRDSIVRVAFAVSQAADDTAAGDYFTALEMARELSKRHRFECVFLEQSAWYDLKDFDVVVAMVDGFRPSLVQSARTDVVLVAWIRNWFDRWLVNPETDQFDAIWVSSQKALDAFSARCKPKVSLLRIATSIETFSQGVPSKAFSSDYCFTGSNFGSWREIIGVLSPKSAPYNFALYGHNWQDVAWLAPYYRGPLPYSSMPDVYASTRIVVDDANHTTLLWGSVNSRVFDAIAGGALVITNSQSASDDGFDGLLPVFTSKESFQALLKRYLDDEEARRELVARLQAIVRERHQYKHRADAAHEEIQRLFACRTAVLRLTDENPSPLAAPFHAALWAAGVTSHFVSNAPSPLARTRSFGAEIDVRFTDMDGVGSGLGGLLPHRANLLVAACDPDQISVSGTRKLAADFDLVVTPDERIAEAFKAGGCETLALVAGDCGVLGLSGVERRLRLQTLFETLLPKLAPQILQRAEGVLQRKLEVPLAVAPALAPKASGPAKRERALRIGYVLWDYPALSQTFVLNEIRWLVRRGHDVKVYFKTAPDKAAVLDFEVDSFRIRDEKDLIELLKLHDRTVMHCPFAYPAAPHLVYPAAQATGVPFTIMPAGVDVSHYDNMQRNRIAEITNSPLCLGVVTIGSYYHRFLVEQGVPNEKIVLERQSVDLPAILPERRNRPPRPRPRVISIGRLIEKKGFRHLIEAAALLPEFDFVLYGYGPLEDSLKRQAQQLNLKNFVFGGALEDSEALWSAYADADLFALPCVRAQDGDMDGLPTVLVEAMAAEVPVVSTSVANVPDLVVDGLTGALCPPKDAQGLAEAIRRLHALPEERRRRMLATALRHARGYAGVDRTMGVLTRLWASRGVDVVLVTYDAGKHRNWAETDQILSRIFKYTTPPFNVYVADNGSDEIFLKKLTERYGGLPNFHLIPLGRNLWCGPASNLAFERGESDYIIYLCSKEGYVLRRGWEAEFVRYMEANPDVGMAGHLITMPKYYDGASYRSYPAFQDFRNRNFADENPDRPFSHVQGGVYVLRRETFERDGGFSEAVPQNGMDVEYSYYLESKGWRLGDIPNVYSATTLTIPGVHAMADERALVIHPLSEQTIGQIDRIIHKEVKSCNICNWQGSAFTEDQELNRSICPNCASDDFSRSTYRLLSLCETLQKRPKTVLVLREESLIKPIGRLAAQLVRHDAKQAVQSWPSREDADLVIVDHRRWTREEADAFVAWAGPFVRQGGSLVLGGGLEAALDPVEALQRLLAETGPALQPVVYDSVVRAFDWRAIAAANIFVHA